MPHIFNGIGHFELSEKLLRSGIQPKFMPYMDNESPFYTKCADNWRVN